MSNVIESAGKSFESIPEGSILHLVTGTIEEFGGFAYFKRYISKRFEKIALPFLFILLIFVLWSQGQFREPLPWFGVSLGFIMNLFFLMMAFGILIFIFGSFIFLKTKAGGAQGAIKFNIINEFTGSRENEMEHDMLIKRHKVLDPSMEQFKIFEDIIDEYGHLDIDIDKEDTMQDRDFSLADIEKDPAIAELIAEIEIPQENKASDSPEFEVTKDKKHKYASAPFAEEKPQTKAEVDDLRQSNQASLVIQKPQVTSSYDIYQRPTYTEVTPLSKFFPDKDKFLVHVIDFTSEYEFRGMKQPGLLMTFPDENLDSIFPQPTDVFATVGMTFGTIPMYCIDLIPIAFKGKVPLYYPVTNKKRNLSLANLGHYHEVLPSQESIISALNLIELVVARPLKLALNHLETQTRSFTGNIDKITRRGMGFADRHINYWKIMHKPETPQGAGWWILAGVIGTLLTSPWWLSPFKALAKIVGINLP